jgi:UDP-N-acetylmuramate--alanine ligase
MRRSNVKAHAGSAQLKKSKFHFVGIGGIGMCGLAELLHNIGAKVTGSDLSENVNTEHLKNIGIEVFKGHRAEQVGDVDVVVFSSAIKSDNPELQIARSRKIPLIPRAEALAEIMRLKRGLAVAGTHGKTTTTSMVAAIFLEAKENPTIVVGGRLDLIQSTAQLGEGEWLIAEADESDGSFNRLSPEIAIITNIDADHLDHFKTFANLQKAFVGFAGKVPFYGSVVICGDDPQVKGLFENFQKNVSFYGFNEANDFVIKGSQGKYELYHENNKLGKFELKVPGTHNALNAVAAMVSAMHAGISFEVCCKGLLRFQGVDRRFHHKGEIDGITVYDDYGHHPTEVRATLQGFREKFPSRRLVVLFQPHRFSRTQNCWDDFKACFSDCDELILTDIYPAGEKPIEGISSQKLAQEVKKDHVQYLKKDASLAASVQNLLNPGDVFVTLGAGDVWKIGMEILGKSV